AVWCWGQRVLWVGLLGGLALVLLVAWHRPDVVILLPAVLAGLCLGVLLFRYPVLNLTVLLSSFVLVVSSDEGIQVTEAIYGVYYYFYIFHWYGVRFAAGARIVRTPLDRAIALFITAGGLLGLGTGIIFGAPLGLLRGDLTAFLMLALYFPVK